MSQVHGCVAAWCGSSHTHNLTLAHHRVSRVYVSPRIYIYHTLKWKRLLVSHLVSVAFVCITAVACVLCVSLFHVHGEFLFAIMIVIKLLYNIIQSVVWALWLAIQRVVSFPTNLTMAIGINQFNSWLKLQTLAHAMEKYKLSPKTMVTKPNKETSK